MWGNRYENCDFYSTGILDLCYYCAENKGMVNVDVFFSFSKGFPDIFHISLWIV